MFQQPPLSPQQINDLIKSFKGPLVEPWELLNKAMPSSQVGDFGFYTDVMEKAQDSTMPRRWIRGVASTPDLDLQKETVLQNGLDLDYFRKHGFYNDNHKPGNDHKVGQPTKAVIKSVKNRAGKRLFGLWNEGYLWGKGFHSGADKAWELIEAMAGSHSDRCMAYSIEGKVLIRDGGRIIKSWVKDIAITAEPINPMTWLEIAQELAKSLYKDEERDSLVKSMTFDPDAYPDTPNRDIEEDEEKALTAGGMGRILVPQSLAGTRHATFVSRHSQQPDFTDDLDKSLAFALGQFKSRGYNEHRAWQFAQAAVARTYFVQQSL